MGRFVSRVMGICAVALLCLPVVAQDAEPAPPPSSGGGTSTPPPTPPPPTPPPTTLPPFVVVLQSDTFDGTPLAWTYDNPCTPTAWNPVAVQWKIDGLPATPIDWPGEPGYHSTPNSMNFNNDVDYDSGGLSWGSVTSPSIDLTNAVNPRLRFWCMFETESGDLDYDQRHLEVSNDGFNSTVFAAQATVTGSVNISDCPWLGQWHQHEVALNPTWGTVQIRFRFYSVDDLFNVWVGWFIDDFEIGCDSVTVPPPPPPPPPPPTGGGSGSGMGTGTGTGGSGTGTTFKDPPQKRLCGGSAGAGPGLLLGLLALTSLLLRRR